MDAPDRNEHLDEEETLARFGGDRDLLRELYDAFVGDAPNKLRAMEQALATGRAEEMAKPAHSLKGAAAAIGAFRCRDLASQLEMAGRRNEPETVKALYPQVLQAMEALLGIIGR